MSVVGRRTHKTRAEPPSEAEAALLGEDMEMPVPRSPTVEIPRLRRTVAIGRPELMRTGMMPPESEQRRLAYEYRRVKQPLIAAAMGRGMEAVPDGRIMMVASALPGEGKSYTTLNLALSMAMDKDLTVLLVDADVAKPHISTVFTLQEEPGLIEALQDPEYDVESLIVNTEVPGLEVLPAGQYVENATELLASERMRQIVAQLAASSERRIVLFDSPPLLLTNESRVLTEVVGQVVIVVRADFTLRGAVMDAIAAVAEHKHVSAILNQSRQGASETYYGYAYGEYGANFSRTKAPGG